MTFHLLVMSSYEYCLFFLILCHEITKQKFRLFINPFQKMFFVFLFIHMLTLLLINIHTSFQMNNF